MWNKISDSDSDSISMQHCSITSAAELHVIHLTPGQ